MTVEHSCRCGYHRWRRIIPLAIMLAGILALQYYTIIVKKPYFLQNPFESFTRFKKKKTEPLHVLLVSYARTGSSFVGDLLQSLPSSFYHFEPLHFLSSPVINDSLAEARALLNRLYNCNVTSVKGFMRWQKEHKNFMKFKRSFLYWKECTKVNMNICYNATFMDKFCKKNKMIITKTIRLKLPDAAEIFNSYPDLNLKVIYLARDPRGTINSRTKFPVSQWCSQDPTCSNIIHYCALLKEDLNTICSLSKNQADNFMVLRYEDLSFEPYKTASKLSTFLGFDYIPHETMNFLKSHTSVVGSMKRTSMKQGLDYPYTTFRNSSITAISWRQKMSFEKVKIMQSVCGAVISGFGYHMYDTVSMMRSDVNYDGDLDSAIRSYCSST